MCLIDASHPSPSSSSSFATCIFEFSSRSTMSCNRASTDTSPTLLLWLGLLASQFASSRTSWAPSSCLVVAHLLTCPTILPTARVVQLSHNIYATITGSCSSTRNISRPNTTWWIRFWGLHIWPSDDSTPMWAYELWAHEIHLPVQQMRHNSI